MKKHVLFLLALLCSSFAFGQQLITFGGSRTTDTAYAARSMRVDSVVRLLRYRTVDSNKVVGFDANGFLVLRTKGTGADSNVFYTKYRSDTSRTAIYSQLASRVKYTDTSSMLNPYLKKVDTASLSNRIDARVKYADTASMLIGYVRAARLNDTAAAIRAAIPNVSGKVNYTDTSAMLTPYLRKADTTAMLLSYARKTLVADTAAAIRASIPNVSGKVNYTDTAAMLAPYYRTATATAALALKQNYTDTTTWDATKKNLADTALALRAIIPVGIDTTSLSNRIDARVKYTDTSAMLSKYLRKADTASLSNRINLKLNSADTASLSTRIDARVKYTDTASMLSPYYKTATATAALATKVNYTDTAAMLTAYLRKVDTASLSTRIDARVKYTDTASMLSPYYKTATATAALALKQNYTDTTTWDATKKNLADTAFALRAIIPAGIDTTSLSNRIDARVKYTDTASMLSPYYRTATATAALATKVNYTDTATMLGGYLRKTDTASLSTRIDGRVKYTDTASMLSPYYKTATATAALATKVNYTDTAAMLSPYYRTAQATAALALKQNYTDTTTWDATKKNLADTALALRALIPAGIDTTSLSNRIDARVKYTDTASMLSPYLRSASAANTYVPYTGATTNVNLGTHSLTAADLVVNHTSGSGVAASITKGGNGEALTVIKSSGSGNAASITGGVTLLDELHLNTDLADAYIASAANWNAKIGAADTSAMLSSYLRKADTASLSTRINTKLNSADTASLSNRINLKLNSTDTASLSNRINLKLNSADTASLSTRIDARVKYSDTSAMLSSYLRKVDTSTLSTRIDARVKYSDTASMLSSYYRTATATAALALKQNYTDTTTWDATKKNLADTSAAIRGAIPSIAGKVNYTDTAAMLSPYYRTATATAALALKQNFTDTTSWDATKKNLADTSAAIRGAIPSISGKVNYTDTAAMLGGYLRKVDTSTLSNRINLKLNSADTASLSNRINLKLNSADTASLSNRINAKVGYGTLTTNYVPKATSTSAIGNSQIFDNGTNVGINTATPGYTLDVNGKGRFQTSCLISSTVDYGWPFQVNNQNFRIYSDGTFGRHTGLNFNTVNWNLAGARSQVQLGTAGSAYENQLVIICQEGPVRINPYGTNYSNRSVIIGNTNGRTEKLQVDGTSYFSGSTLVGTGTANASALLEVNSTTQGLGLPSMTTTQQNAIATPRTGLAVYNSTLAAPTYYNGTAWSTFGGASGWGLTGNAGTSAATNFIGTTDDIDLMFRRNNISSGRISTNNTAFGNGAGAALSGGGNNALFGAGAGGKLTNPSQNTYFGFNAGSEVVSGFNNIYIGAQAASSTGHTAGNKNLVISHQGLVATNNGANQLNIGNVLWGVNCSATGTTAAGRLGIGTNAPNASAILDLTSTTQGLLLPRMTTAQINAIASPAAGLSVYNTDLLLICFFNGTAWQQVVAIPM